jgi:hypothetical protein
MGSKIFGFCILLVVCVGLYLAYDHYHTQKQLDSGDVTCTGCMTPEQSAAYEKEDHGETADGQSEHKIRTAREENALGNPLGQAAAGQTAAATPATPATPPVAPAAGATSTTTAAAAPPAQPAAPQPTYNVGAGAPPTSLPAHDTLPANAPNELHFSGSGNYQWYRQGNLTYRVDTVSGRSCIAYATLDEWRKQIVSSHGCGRGA